MRHRMNIAFFGSSLLSAYWNGAATYYRGIIRALARRGHRITFYEPDAFDRQKHRDIPVPDWAHVEVYDPGDAAALDRHLAAARQADLVVKASGVGVLDAELEEAVAALSGSGRMTAFWDVDAPATLARLARDPADPFHRLVRRFDLILTYGGGAPVVSAYRARGARRCVPIYNALDPETHFAVPPSRQFAADLSLLANRLPDREARIEEFFFKPVALLSERRFLLGGNGWSDRSFPPQLAYLGHVYTRDHNAFNCSALAVLNVSRDSMAGTGFSPATRIFEAAGAGACIITDAWEGIEMFLEPRREILVARSGEEVAGHLASLTPETARAIGTAARRRILAEHTYATRALLLEDVLEGVAA